MNHMLSAIFIGIGTGIIWHEHGVINAVSVGFIALALLRWL